MTKMIGVVLVSALTTTSSAPARTATGADQAAIAWVVAFIASSSGWRQTIDRELSRVAKGHLAYMAVHADHEVDGASASPVTDYLADCAFEVLHTFGGGIDGSYPPTNVIQATDGNFYGTTPRGGAFDTGVIFRMTPDGGDYAILHAFAGGTDGAFPNGALIEADDGNFYGTTARGGGACFGGCGTVFRMAPDGAVTVLHAFTGDEGAFPVAALVQGADGSFYGTTQGGGSSECGQEGCGTVFKITRDGTFAVLHTFHGEDGAEPTTRLIQATDADLYGTTQNVYIGCTFFTCEHIFGATAFKITPEGDITVLVHFGHPPMPDEPIPHVSGLTEATDGGFYGTFGFGNPFGVGDVFRVTADGSFTSVHSFGGAEGNDPLAELIQAADGNFYGTTSGTFGGFGTVFVMTPDGTVTPLYSFTGGDDGSHPTASLVQAMDGSFYGTTLIGGSAGQGVVFRLAVGSEIRRP